MTRVLCTCLSNYSLETGPKYTTFTQTRELRHLSTETEGMSRSNVLEISLTSCLKYYIRARIISIQFVTKWKKEKRSIYTTFYI